MGSQLKQEFIEQVTKAISEVMRIKKVSIGDIGLHNSDISEQMNVILSPTWKEKYGLVVTDVAMGDINITEASLARINKIDDATIFSDAKLQSGLMATASADAMVNASKNENGAMMGFAGMNLAGNAGAGLMGAVNQNVAQQAAPAPAPAEAAPAQPAGGAIPNFCPNCGSKTNGMNFCGNCGHKLV
jgi:membrane protease subunit (stomatin/prohibitin family)